VPAPAAEEEPAVQEEEKPEAPGAPERQTFLERLRRLFR